MSLTILATADIHIGRRPTRLPDPDDAQRCSCAAMWDTIVETAIDRQVDLIVLAGDVVESDNQYFEALGRLEQGLRRLSDNGIHTYAVSGNHDYEVFPRILRLVGDDFFHLLGRNGVWESVYYPQHGDKVVQLHGWSFPARYVDCSPLDDYDLSVDPAVPTIGLLHADVDASDSRYGPVASRQLQTTDANLWIMGHVHQPKRFDGDKTLYTGSPQAMDPGETGDHGPWLIEIDGTGEIRLQHLVMSRVRYDGLSVPLNGVEMEEAFQEKLTRDVGDYLDKISSLELPPDYAVLRVTLEGTTSLCGRLDGLARRVVDEFERTVGSVIGRIEQVANHTRPVIDLEQIARRQDPTGVLAATLLKLEKRDDNEEIRRLLQGALESMREVHEHSTYADLPEERPPDIEDTRRQLLQQGLMLLETLREQEPSA